MSAAKLYSKLDPSIWMVDSKVVRSEQYIRR